MLRLEETNPVGYFMNDIENDVSKNIHFIIEGRLLFGRTVTLRYQCNITQHSSTVRYSPLWIRTQTGLNGRYVD